MKGLPHHIPTDEDISNILKEFTVDFLLKGYGFLVQELHAQLLSETVRMRVTFFVICSLFIIKDFSVPLYRHISFFLAGDVFFEICGSIGIRFGTYIHSSLI
jgi:hypothetical protein